MNPSKIFKAILLSPWAVSALGCGGPDGAAREQADAGSQEAADAGSIEIMDAEVEVEEIGPCIEPESGLHEDLYCTGLYSKRASTLRAPSAMPYTPGVTLWSDGAEKHRFLFLPSASQIDTSNMDAWRFPVGTKAWKEFRLAGKLVETRLLWKRSETKWESGTYVWDSDGLTATLNTNTKGTLLESGYEIPAARDCDKCHHGASDKLLGVEAVAMALPTSEGVTLAALVASGSLSHPPAQVEVTLPEDGTGKAASVLGYLHANCGMPCHSSRGLGDETQLVLRLRADEFWPTNASDPDAAVGRSNVPASVNMTDIYQATVGQRATTASVIQAFPMAQRVTPGDHEQSLIWLLSHVRGKYQMPPLVSHRIDDVGTQALADWIDALRK